MSLANPKTNKSASCVILSLDGILLNTDEVVQNILKVALVKYGKQWDGREANRTVGKTPLEAAEAVVKDYELPCRAEEFLSDFSPMFKDQCRNIKVIPGANRLINHLRSHHVPMAVASNSPRESLERKMSFHEGWKELFCVIIAGDDVRNTKPSPEMFLEAAKRLDLEPSSCLVIEDCMSGVIAGKAAGMEVVLVPSVPKQTNLYETTEHVVNSLYDLRLELWGLPPFEDWIECTLPLEPSYLHGSAINGLGHDSKLLGIPTANLSTKGQFELLSKHPSGVFFGWAGLSTLGVYKTVVSIGWNPYFQNSERTIESWLLHDFDEDFYGEELRLVVLGYIRPQANVSSLERLILKMHEDKEIAKKALDHPLYSKYRNDPYLSG